MNLGEKSRELGLESAKVVECNTEIVVLKTEIKNLEDQKSALYVSFGPFQLVPELTFSQRTDDYKTVLATKEKDDEEMKSIRNAYVYPRSDPRFFHHDICGRKRTLEIEVKKLEEERDELRLSYVVFLPIRS